MWPQRYRQWQESSDLNLRRRISRAHAAQQCSTLIAAKCDEMQMAKAGDAFQASRHTQRSERPTLCQHQNRKG
jgi:hypothetical protein